MSAPWFDQPRLLDELQRLVEVESPSSDLAALDACRAVLAEIGEGHLGAAPEELRVEDRTHLRWRFGSGEPRVVLIGHYDTVWPLGTLGAFPFTRSGDIVRGPGVFDMKGGLLMALHALAELRRSGGDAALDGVSLLCTADEEIGSPTSRALIEAEARHARAALVLESAGPGATVKIGRKGVSFYELQIHGLAAHAGVEPEKGVNAGVEAAHQILHIAGLAAPAAGTSVVPSVVRAGTVTNTVPAHASIAIDSRARTAVEQERVQKDLHALRAQLPGARLELAGGINRPPMEPETASTLLPLVQGLAEQLGHRPIDSAVVGGGSDANFTAGIGTPTLDGLGTVGGGAHAADEHIDVGWLEERTELLAHLVGALLRPGS